MNVGKVQIDDAAGKGGFQYYYTTSGQTATLTDYDAFTVFENDISLESGSADLILHEIGHALTLKHPFSGSPVLPTAYDNNKYTIMSYTSNPDTGLDNEGYLAFDIAALQQRWGANMNTATGNDVYTGPRIPTVDVIWDAGGTDKLSAFGYSTDVLIDLNEGAFSRFGTNDDVAIAYGVVIENATGGNSHDLIIGNAQANTLAGGNGNDNLSGGGGNDYFIGGNGIDTYDGGSGSDTARFDGNVGWRVDLGTGTAKVGSQTEMLTSIENVVGSNGNDTITGTAYSNDLYGGNGDDMLIGGGGIDDYYGGSGSDTVDLSGSNSKWRVDLGNDTAEMTTATGNVYNVDFENIESVIGPRNSLTLLGTSGNEEARGNSFADIFYTRGGVDEFHGSYGSDTVSFSGYGEGLTIRGSAGYGRLGDGTQVTTFTGIENIFATSEDDDITGTAGNNTIVGRSGADRINGGSGNDIIQGGLGRDLLTGGRGNDTIDGGSDPNDYAFFSGNQSQYNISTSAGGVTTVEWIGPGNGDGTDTLTNIEFLGFDDGFYYV
ncbi:M10 family metallopeptidase C-terminal domain-containing protein [Hoeflea sp. IMCC20628]|uniref:M10 family metallopeptidase C-terminal domain-containing protein n=1 Tax=Hoeflea sp. IMCC20628 TaxID=1620421 RepID=UPI0018CED9F7|nr:M10 family metallopeptidase C-terminal domain-containing protein [Hoeflea sp. IMCC20628]